MGRVAVNFGAGQGAKRSEPDWHSRYPQRSRPSRATQASAKIHSNPGGREAEGQLAASLARYSPLRGCASLAPCHLPFCLYARPIPFFQKSPMLPLQVVWMLARLASRINRPAQIAALLVWKILGTPD